MKEKSQKQDSRYLTDLELRCEKNLSTITLLLLILQGVQDQNLPKEMAIIPSILVQIEKLLCHNLFLIRTIFSSH